MRLHLPESDHDNVETAECAFASLVLHTSLTWLAVGVIMGSGVLPAVGRDTAALFLVPPDRKPAPTAGQIERFQVGRPGGYYTDGEELTAAGSGTQVGGRPYGRLRAGERSSALGLAPMGQTARPADSVFTMLEVDRMVERYEFSAAPIYPPKLAAEGKQGRVHATFVVDTTGGVDMTSVQVLESDDPEFTQSVRAALGAMRFRPATRGGKVVRQLVEQRFNFRIAPPTQGARAGQIS
ncbi:MAG TPA: energy transducer TonB [Gemmatimonadales bacterium]|nr:energy transducer TonB [Gemmatimonadales bacterium]